MLRDNLEGWDGVGWGGRWEGDTRRRGRVFLWLNGVDVWQKPTQHCKAIILQLKINIKKRLRPTEEIKQVQNICFLKE